MTFYEQNGYMLAKGAFTCEKRMRAGAPITVSVSDPSVCSEGWTSGAKMTNLHRYLMHCHNVQFHSAILA